MPLSQQLFGMTSSNNNNPVVRSSIDARTKGQDNFLLTMKTLGFTITDDDDDDGDGDDELDLPSQATNPPNIIRASSDVQPSVLRPAASQQPTVEMLQSLGIKVRDFAYESTLPPIAPVPRVPRQIQPSARPLKRTSRDWEEEHGASSRSSRPQFGREATNAGTVPDGKPNSLVRRPTEPLEFDLSVSRPMMECGDLSRAFPLGSQLPFRTCRDTPPKTPIASPPTSPLFGSPFQDASQESEMVMTPSSGEPSHIEDTSSIPVSQLDSVTESALVPEEISQISELFPQPLQHAISLLTPMRSSVAPRCVSPPVQGVDAIDSYSPRESTKRGTGKGSSEKTSRYLLRRRSLLSAHTPTRSRYPHPLTPGKKGSVKVSPLTRRRRLQQPGVSR